MQYMWQKVNLYVSLKTLVPQLNANAYDTFQLQSCEFKFKRYKHICKDGMQPYAFLLYAFYWPEVWACHLVRLEKWCDFLLSWLSGKTFSEGGTQPGSDLNINVVRWDGKLLVWRRKNVWGKPPAGQQLRDAGRKEREDLSLAPCSTCYPFMNPVRRGETAPWCLRETQWEENHGVAEKGWGREGKSWKVKEKDAQGWGDKSGWPEEKEWCSVKKGVKYMHTFAYFRCQVLKCGS